MVNNSTTTSKSSNSIAHKQQSNQMPYNLRKHKETQQPKSSIGSQQHKVIKQSSIVGGNTLTSKPSSSCSVYSSSCTSTSSSPSPSPSYSSTFSIDSNNNANSSKKHQQQAMIQLCYDEPIKLNELLCFEDLISINTNLTSKNDLNDETIVNMNSPLLNLSNKTNSIATSVSNKSIKQSILTKTPLPNLNQNSKSNNKNILKNSLFKDNTSKNTLFNKNTFNSLPIKTNITQSAQSTITTRSKLKRQAAVEETQTVNSSTNKSIKDTVKFKNHLVTNNLKITDSKNNKNDNVNTPKINQITKQNTLVPVSTKTLKPILHQTNTINPTNQTSKKVKKKKRVSVINKFKQPNEMNVDDASDYSDNDDTSDSSDEDEVEKTIMLPNQSTTSTIKTTTSVVTNSSNKKIVSFATNTQTTTCTTNCGKNKSSITVDHNKTGRTPPHRKFRKLRLFDTAYTPKTLIKKATDAMKIETKNDLKEINGITQSDKIIEIKPESSNNKNNLECSPPHNQLFKTSKIFTEIIENVHQTPKSLRRTPIKQSALSSMRLNMSPNFNINQDVEMQESCESSRSSSSMSNQITTSTSKTSTRLRLFETTKTNKTLNFDDSDDEPTIKPQQAVTTDEEMQYLFEQPEQGTFQSKSVPNTYLSHQSLFKPINKLCNILNPRLNNSNSLQSISTLGNGPFTRSPNSPFLISNQNTTNINPFTPTNLYDNSKLTSASNAALIAKSYLSNSQTPHLLKQSSLQKDNTNVLNKSSSLQQLPTIQSSSIKRCFDYSTSNNNINEIQNGEKNEVETNDLNNSVGYQQQSINKEDHSNSLPRNKRLALRQCLVSRYHEEFHEVCKLGSGEFGDVFKCINRLDGCTYAIKRSKKPILGGSLEVAAWKEVCAHAALGQHHHIVQYYSAWAECDRMLIQNEYCNGGSLAEFIESLKASSVASNNDSEGPSSLIQNNLKLNEADLKILLLHIAKGLAYMHSKNLAHLDIKPGNIFICRSPRRHNLNIDLGVAKKIITNSTTTTTIVNGVIINEESGIESEEIDEDEPALLCKNPDENVISSLFSEIITYKIGDLGHVTSTVEPHVEEGDCRYLPNEILQEQYNHLIKADIFSLALTVFVSGSLEELPKNGDEWHWIRKGNLKDLPQCSERFKKLLLQMIHENPIMRPSASTLIHHPCICPDATKSKAQLRRELNQEKFKNEMLQRKVKKYEEQMNCQKLEPSPLLSSHFGAKSIDITTVNSNNKQFTNGKFVRSLSSTFL